MIELPVGQHKGTNELAAWRTIPPMQLQDKTAVAVSLFVVVIV